MSATVADAAAAATGSRLYFRPEAGPPLELVEFHGTAAAGAGFRFDLVVRPPAKVPVDAAAVEAALVGRPAGFGLGGKAGRPFHGYVSRCVSAGRREFHLTVVPWLALLAHTVRSRVYVGQPVPDVLDAVFAGAGRTDFRWAADRGAFPTPDRLVQYRESDAAFVSRVCEREGITSYWEFEADRHVLVLADGTVPPAECPGGPFQVRPPQGRGAVRREAGVTSWHRARSLTPSRVTVNEYDHTAPDLDRAAAAAVADPDPAVGPDGIDWPASGHATAADGERLAYIRAGQEQAGRVVASGTGTVPGFDPGLVVVPATRDGPGEPHLLIRVRHAASRRGYENDFQCVPLAQGYRPPSATRVPVIPGYQTAVVVGSDFTSTPAADPVHTDEFGRVKVRFRWAGPAADGGDPSGWVRVAHPGGAQRIPRVGEEVVVVWEHGDPDRPLVLGHAYPTAADAPDPPAKHPLRHVVTQPTADGGGTANEVRLDGKAGAERLRLDSAGDVVVRAGRDLVAEVGADLAEFVGGNHVEEVGGGRWTKLAEAWVATAREVVFRAIKEMILKSDGPIHIEGSEITLIGGGSYLRLTKSGVELEGTLIQLNCGGPAPARSADRPAAPAKKRPKPRSQVKTRRRTARKA